MRIAVTGLGVICASGKTVPEFWANIAAGCSSIGPIQLVDRSLLRAPNGAEVRGYNPLAHFDPRRADLLDRFAQFAVIAARQAVVSAGFEKLPDDTAIFTGACVGGQSSEDEQFRRMYQEGSARIHPLTIPRVMANAGASALAEEFGIHGPAMTISTACSSSAHALAMALWTLRSGAAPVAIAGGSEAVFSLGFLRSWEAMRVLSADTCRPFSRDRSGLILGEGAAMLVLEPLDAAQARGATIYAEFAGAGMSADGHHITQPSAAGAALAIQRALADAQLNPNEIGYINAHGTATLTNDPTECEAIRLVFGPQNPKAGTVHSVPSPTDLAGETTNPKGGGQSGLSPSPTTPERTSTLFISSTKSMHGHTLGAAGAIEALATVLALHHGMLPPTANFTELDPACNLPGIAPLANQAREQQVEAALSNSFAFGGLNAVLGFRRAR